VQICGKIYFADFTKNAKKPISKFYMKKAKKFDPLVILIWGQEAPLFQRASRQVISLFSKV